MPIWTSWNGNITHSYNSLYFPQSEKELISIIQGATSIRVIGNGQSSSDIVAGTDVLIDLKQYFNNVIDLDRNKKQLTVETGITLKLLLETIEEQGWALPCLPDIDSITLGGALATGTHGTGKEGFPLSSYVTMFRVIHADGTIEKYQRGDREFDAIKISLGLLGVIASVTLQCVPLYTLKLIESPMKDSEWLSSFPNMLNSKDFVRILWLPHTNSGYVITGDITEKCDADVHTATPWHHKYRRTVSKFLYRITRFVPLLTVPANNIIAILFFRSTILKGGTLYQATVTKSRSSTLELAEWTIPLERFFDTFTELKSELHRIGNGAYAHIPMDIRFIKKDTAWLGYSCDGDTVTVGCVSRNASRSDAYKAFEVIEKVFLKHGGRPHWAKRFSADRKTLAKLYPKWDDFCEIRMKLDPKGKFLNDYLKRLFT